MDDPPRAHLVHALPLRVRVIAPLLAGRRALLEEAARALSATTGAARVTARPETGSFILEDDTPLDGAAVTARLDSIVRALRDERGAELRPPPPEDYPGPTRIARAVVHAVSGINGDVRAALDERADLGTILPVIFAVGGVAEVIETGRMPLPTWFNLLWWSLRSFMTFNIRAVEEEVGNGRDIHRAGRSNSL